MPADIKARPSGNDDARAKKCRSFFPALKPAYLEYSQMITTAHISARWLNSIGTAPGIAC